VIAKRLEWDFVTFMIKMAPITIIVWPMGLGTCFLLEKSGTVEGYGDKMPDHGRQVLFKFVDDQCERMLLLRCFTHPPPMVTCNTAAA
jgi:Na+:H+ antiporter, NhaB family